MKSVFQVVGRCMLSMSLAAVLWAGPVPRAAADDGQWIPASGSRTRQSTTVDRTETTSTRASSGVRPAGYWTTADVEQPATRTHVPAARAEAPAARSRPDLGATSYNPAPYARPQLAQQPEERAPTAARVDTSVEQAAYVRRPGYTVPTPARAPAYRQATNVYQPTAYDEIFSEGDQSLPGAEILPAPAPVPEYDNGTIYEGMPYDSHYGSNRAPWQEDIVGGCAECGGEVTDGGCMSCGAVYHDPCSPCGHDFFDPCLWTYAPELFCSDPFPVCSPLDFLNELSLGAGVTSFKGPIDQGQNGNYGFTETINVGHPIWHAVGLGHQAGVRFTQTNLSGSTVAGPSDNTRNQVFFSTGLFHRAFNTGWQFGAVFDYMHDNFYVDSRVTQIRGEISYVAPRGNEIGFWGSFGTLNDTVLVDFVEEDIQPTDLYTVFYRKNVAENGGQGRVWGGVSGYGDGLFGADFRAPMSNRAELVGGFNYLIPQESSGAEGATEESWGLTMQIVWYPMRKRAGIHNGPYRPLFGVADNMNFMIDRKPN